MEYIVTRMEIISSVKRPFPDKYHDGCNKIYGQLSRNSNHRRWQCPYCSQQEQQKGRFMKNQFCLSLVLYKFHISVVWLNFFEIKTYVRQWAIRSTIRKKTRGKTR
jgi:hypothetical protein